MGRYNIVSIFFRNFYGPPDFAKNQYGFVSDWFGSLWIANDHYGTAQDNKGLFRHHYGIVKSQCNFFGIDINR